MKQVSEISIDASIIPNEGIGQIKLGMNSFYLRDFYSQNFRHESGGYSSVDDKGKWRSELWKPFFGNLNLVYDDCLVITINLYNGAISHLKVKNNYQGKVDGLVGIGDSMREYYQSHKNSFCDFEDGSFFYWADKDYGLLFHIGDKLEDFPDEEIFEKYLDMPILEIEIFDDKQRLGIGIDLPDDWI